MAQVRKAKLSIPVGRYFQPLIPPARYKGCYGGRGSGKSHHFAEAMIHEAVARPGFRGVCIREVQKDLRHSAKLLIEDKLAYFGIGEAQGFRVQREMIETPYDGIIIFQGMQDQTAASIKSLEGIDVAWVEEAQTLNATSLQLLRPTIRKPGSELWFSWNPRRKVDPVDQLFRGKEKPSSYALVRVNWSENLWFPSELEVERTDCLRITPEQYGHIWEGDYASVLTGAYYATCLADARRQGRIGRVTADPLMLTRCYWDIGGAGRHSDATAIWVCQFVGQTINVIDYYETEGQALGFHLNWLRAQGYAGALQCLPHDASKAELTTGTRYEDHIREAGFTVETVPHQGRASDMKRIEAARRRFPAIWFNEETTQAGLDCLGWYHELQDENRSIGLGPDHDWSCHAADAFGMMCTHYTPPQPVPENTRAKALARSIV
jgi:phage terminase large subunit